MSVVELLAALTARLSVPVEPAQRRFAAFEALVFPAHARRRRQRNSEAAAAVYELAALGLDGEADRVSTLALLLQESGFHGVAHVLARLRRPVTALLMPAFLSEAAPHMTTSPRLGWPEEREEEEEAVARSRKANHDDAGVLLQRAMGLAPVAPAAEHRQRVPAYLCGLALAELDGFAASHSHWATLVCLARAMASEVDAVRCALARLPTRSFLDFNRHCEPVLQRVRRLVRVARACRDADPCGVLDALHAVVQRPGGRDFEALLDAVAVPLRAEVDAFLLGRSGATADFFLVNGACVRLPEYVGGNAAVRDMNAAARHLQARHAPLAAAAAQLSGSTPRERLASALARCAPDAESAARVHAALSRVLLHGDAFDTLVPMTSISDGALAFFRLANATTRAVCAASKHAREVLFATKAPSWMRVHLAARRLEAHVLDTLAHSILPRVLAGSDAELASTVDDVAERAARLAWALPEQAAASAAVRRVVAVALSAELSPALLREFEEARAFLARSTALYTAL